jgi:beta-lactamase superfamily II metal-dependent hydrolase
MKRALPESLPVDELKALDPTSLYVFVVGPGEGEAIAIALPNAQGWLLLDGCRSGDGGIGLVDVLERWRRGDEPIHAYALTHPHTDHAKGIVELVEVYGPSIRVVAVTPPWAPPVPPRVTSQRIVVQQVRKGLDALEKLCATGAQRVDLVAGCVLRVSGPVLVSVHSPGPEDIMHATEHNERSAVIEVEHGEARVVLGSDLPTKTPHGGGWRAVLKARQALRDHLVLKIPHHGSRTSHASDLFQHHDRSRGWAVTPFNNHALPDVVRMDGLKWILDRGGPVHLTALPVSKSLQVPLTHPGVVSLASLQERVAKAPTRNPLLDTAAETTPRAVRTRDSLWCFAVDATGRMTGRWRGQAAIEVSP